MKNIKRFLALLLVVVSIGAICLQAAPVVKAATTLYWPVPGHTKLSGVFSDSHGALDINDSSINGSMVVAAMSGKISVMTKCEENHYGSYGDCNGGGTCVIIYGDDGRTYSYAHMQAGSIPSNYKVGTYITAGTQIGRVGSTGHSSDPHLHFSIAKSKNYWENLVNPSLETYIYSALFWPVPGHTKLSRGFSDSHEALDINDSSINGVKVIAAMSGKISVMTKCTENHYGSYGDCNGGGTCVIIYGDDGRTYSYAHMQAGSIPSNYKVGTYITAGTQIGRVGSTGNSSGPHLHFSIAKSKNYWENLVNPSLENYYHIAGDLCYFADLPGRMSASNNDAVIAQKLYKLQGATPTKYGAKLYDRWGRQLGSVSDSITGYVDNTYIEMWWTVSTAFKVKLWPGQTYQFDFWATVDGTTYTSPRRTFTTTGTAPTVKVNYNANGGSGTMPATTVSVGGTLTLAANQFTRTGYKFAGWNVLRGDGKWYVSGQGWTTESQIESGNSKYFYTDKQSMNFSTIWYLNLSTLYDYTFYAIWEKNPNASTYTLTYDANGGSGAPGSQTKTQDQTLTLSSTKPTRTGYTFQGWATSASATTAAYQPGDSFTGNANTTLYAVWKANTYTLTYDANGGSGAPGSQTKTYGVALYLSSTKPTRSGYTFQGWATSATATEAKYQPGDRFTGNANNTLYAVWEKNPVIDNCETNGHSYKVTFTAPTCESDGYSTYTCSACGHSYKADEVAAFGHHYSNGTCTTCGKINTAFTGIANRDGALYYIQDDKIATDVTGLIKYDGIWYYVKSGKVASETTDLVKYNGEWFYVVKGKVASGMTDLVNWGGEWFYVVKGKLAANTTTLIKWNGGWYYIYKGKLAGNTTNLIKYNGEWWYVIKGRVASEITDLVKYNGEWFYVVKGKIASNTTKLVEFNGGWYYIYKGKLAAKTTTLVKHNGSWYYVVNGKVNFNYNGKVLYSGTYYKVKNGKVV